MEPPANCRGTAVPFRFCWLPNPFGSSVCGATRWTPQGPCRSALAQDYTASRSLLAVSNRQTAPFHSPLLVIAWDFHISRHILLHSRCHRCEEFSPAIPAPTSAAFPAPSPLRSCCLSRYIPLDIPAVFRAKKKPPEGGFVKVFRFVRSAVYLDWKISGNERIGAALEVLPCGRPIGRACNEHAGAALRRWKRDVTCYCWFCWAAASASAASTSSFLAWSMMLSRSEARSAPACW